MGVVADEYLRSDGLAPHALESEFLAGALWAGVRLEHEPHDPVALAAMSILRSFDPKDLSLKIHREICVAMQSVVASTGTVTPALLAEELDRRKSVEARDAVADLPFGMSPMRTLGVHAVRIAEAARRRRAEARGRRHQS